MKKLFSVLAVGLMLAFGVNAAMAQPPHWDGVIGGNPGNFGGNPDSGKAFWKNGNDGNGNGGGDNGCEGPTCQESASGNFDISVKAIGGGISADGKTIPNGAAGGFGIAGGVGAGEASGAFESFRFLGRTVTLGGAEANIGVTAGGVTQTTAYTFNPGGFGIGVGSYTDNYAVIGGHVDGNACGLAYSSAMVGAIGGQASLNGSVLFGSPLPVWDSHGMTYGLAGQGSVGAFVIGGGAAGLGSYEADAGIDMWGGSYSESYRGINFLQGGKTEYMGSNVGAWTHVTSYGNADSRGFAGAYAEGCYLAGGFATSKTVQFTDSGFAKATAAGSYTGSGPLGTGFNGSANGYTYTSATTFDGYNGSIMSASAGMSVSSGAGTPQ